MEYLNVGLAPLQSLVLRLPCELDSEPDVIDHPIWSGDRLGAVWASPSARM